MNARAKLFQYKQIYDLAGSQALFIEAMRESILHHEAHGKLEIQSMNLDDQGPQGRFYADFLKAHKFDPKGITTMEDVEAIPMIPVDFFKSQVVRSIDPSEVVVHATSSGTRGQKSQVFLDQSSIDLGTKMIIKSMRYHGLISLLPTNYLLLGYEPQAGNDMSNVKVLTGMTRFAPAVFKTFAFKATGLDGAGGYQLDARGLLKAVKLYSRMGLPVRILGFPSALYMLLMAMKEAKMAPVKLNPKSVVLTGGGWKQFDGMAIGKEALYSLVQEMLGINPKNCRDFYSAVEHSVAYPECKNHHMHVPIWSRVVIRHVKTLEPVGFGVPGFLNFISPLVSSMPLSSVLMADLAVLHDGTNCGCGITSPYFEVLGRATTTQGKSCAISASELIGKNGGGAHGY